MTRMNPLHRRANRPTGRLNLARSVTASWLAALMLAAAPPLGAQTAGGSSAQAEPPVVNSSLTAPLFYQLLLGELNVVSGEPGTGFSLILDAARKQKDEQLFKRAVDLALQARSGDAALSAAQAWAQQLPESLEAHRHVLQILLALNRPGDTAPALRSLLERSPPHQRSDVISAIPQTYARVADKAAALRVVREALSASLQQRDTTAAAWATVGRMQLASDQGSQALESARTGQSADPASPYPALLALELMERGHAEAEALVKRYLQAAPTTSKLQPSVTQAYARTLLDLQRNAEARTLLAELTRRQPELPEPWLLLGNLQVQENALNEASRSLESFMRLARESGDERIARGLTQAYLLMAQIAEKQKNYAAANAWIDRIENADEIMAAQLRRASLLARQGQLDKARALLRNHPERRPEDARLKLTAETQLLRDLKAWPQAFEVYAEAVSRYPDDVELLYEQASVAEKMGKPEVMERLLRQLIALKPDHHHAYNALGYSLADRGQRLPEAKQLIEKAVALAPDDAYIQDSLGWVEFRLGNKSRALELLQAAYAKRPDAEIAAHLGEVLWSTGQRDQALKIWREGLLLASDNETLQSTLKRLRVKP